jgi:hydrogenase maturation protease
MTHDTSPSMPEQGQVLVAGIGNIFLGDDAFGVEVVQRLARRELPPGARVVDFGIRGFDLAHALLEPHAAVILVDATPRDNPPGTLYVLELELTDAGTQQPAGGIEPHAMHPLRVLELARSLGARPRRVLVVGCEPTPLDEAEALAGSMGLTEPVAAVIDEAVDLVHSLVTRELKKAVVCT